MSIYNGNALTNVNIGTSANDGTGDPLRNAFVKVNNNFIDLYTFLGNGTHLGNISRANLGNVVIGNITLTGSLTTTGGASALPPTGVSSGTYGDSSNYPSISVD